MEKFEFKVIIEAQSNEEARQILVSMFDIMKTVRQETGTKDFIDFAAKLKAKPGLVKKAKLFI